MFASQRARVVLLAVAAFGLVACAHGSANGVTVALQRGHVAEALAAYDRGARDANALRRIALVVIEQEAASRDRARSAHALSALQRAGDAGEPALQRLATRTRDRVVRAQALALLARRGDAAARAALRAELSDADPDVQAAAVEALDPATEPAELRRLAQSPASVVRIAAFNALRRAPKDVDTRVVLSEAARLDPALPARLAALRALSEQGPEALDAIEARVEDSAQAVRLLAIDELVAGDYARAERRLLPYLTTDPSPEGVESARMLLATAPERAPDSAIAQLERALAASDNAVRGAAAVALLSTRDARVLPLAAARAPHEHARSVRLCLALTLGATRGVGREQLQALMAAEDVVGGQAAAELARGGDAPAVQRLRALLASRNATVRRVAVDALGGDPRTVHDVRASMLDPDASVRLSAASAILTA